MRVRLIWMVNLPRGIKKENKIRKRAKLSGIEKTADDDSDTFSRSRLLWVNKQQLAASRLWIDEIYARAFTVGKREAPRGGDSTQEMIRYARLPLMPVRGLLSFAFQRSSHYSKHHFSRSKEQQQIRRRRRRGEKADDNKRLRSWIFIQRRVYRGPYRVGSEGG